MAIVGGKQETDGMIMCSKNVELVPDDVFFEILSWLPVISVLRFKCVCKSWKIITEDQSFIQKHESQSKCQKVYDSKSVTNENERFLYKTYSNGLVLEKSEKTDKYRIRNPATKQVLEVLDDPEEQGVWRAMTMHFDSLTSNYKLIYIYRKKETSEYGTKILTVGTDLAWRSLGVSLSSDNNRRNLFWKQYNEFFYIIWECPAEVDKTEIVILKLDDESFMKIKIPPGFQSAEDPFRTFIWDEKLSIGFIIEEKLHAWVLKDYKKQIWSEKKIIPLNFMNEYPNINEKLVLRKVSKSLLKFYIDGNWLEYDIDSQKQKLISKTRPGKKILYYLYPSLVSLKGMHSEGINPCPVSL